MQIVEDIPKLKPRPIDAHKGDFGKVCIIAGSIGMSGAAALAGRAALRAGAGLVRLAMPQSILPIAASIEPSYTTVGLPEDDKGRISEKALPAILRIIAENDAVAFGPGIGQSTNLRTILEKLIQQQRLPLVIDADGLNNLAKIKNWHQTLNARLILTPHPGEMKRLWSSLFREPLPQSRSEQAARVAQLTKTTVVLKGAATVVTDGEKIYINKTGNPGMATAGSGDVLTGVITALLAQGLCRFDACVLAVYIHGLAGDIATEKYGQISIIATDIIDALCRAFMQGLQN
jgi:NAD(P)H-hydrate epimerase